MSKHTPGPWRADEFVGCIFDPDGKPIMTGGIGHREAWANAARIVACVNALEGIDDPAAARVLLDEPRMAAATDMLHALKLAQGAISPECAVTYETVKAAIAKAEGRK
jgi:hypothetical protein